MRDEQGRSSPERTLSLDGLWELFGRHTRSISVTIVTSVLASIVLLSQRAPSYRARATLILDDPNAEAGILGDLAALGKAPQAASQIEILRARSTAEETVGAPSTTPEQAGYAEDAARHLGLTTLVEDPLLEPLRELAFSDEPEGRLPPRLRARWECDDEFGPLRELELRFLGHDRVRVEEAGWFSDLEIEAELGCGAIELPGGRLWLTPEGDLRGRSFRIVRQTREQAIERLRDATRARETERNSGVIELSVDDSDPRRAADTANALCRNYLARSEARGDRRASHTVEFIRQQLERQLTSLRAAEAEVVRLQSENPRAIDVTASGEALIEQLSALEVQRMQLELDQVAARQALETLRRGDIEALSRLSVELGDPITATYLESLARLSAEHALQERSDAGAYKLLLQQRAIELEGSLDATELDLRELEDALAALERGDARAVARLGGGPPAANDPLLESYLTSLAELQTRAATLQRELTPEHPERVQVERDLGDALTRLRQLVGARLEAHSEQRDEQRQLLASYRERAEAFPRDERARIDSALERLRARTAAHLESRLRGLESSSAALSARIATVETSLGALPEEERRVAEPIRELSAHTEIVKLLLTKEQEARITEASNVASAEFIDLAVPGVERSGPSIPLHLLFGALLGVIAGLGLALGKESLARTVFTAAELELATGLSVVGTIPDFRRGRFRVRRAGEHFVALRDDPEGASADAYRSMRANLKFLIGEGSQIRTVAASSCAQGEGKSSTNVALAMSFAKSGRRVLLIDCDMRRPSVDKYLGVRLETGLSDVLGRGLDWNAAVQRNVEARLDVLSAGLQPASPSDLLDSEAFERLLREVRDRYDLVVCDVPPAMAVSDIESCAARIDALLVVVRADKVTARAVTETVKRLKQSGAKLVGAVLNGVGTSIANGRYGYGYGYGYGRSGQGRRAS